MGYLFLVLSLIAGTTKGYFGKKISIFTSTLHSSVSANLVRMLLCALIGALLVFDSGLMDWKAFCQTVNRVRLFRLLIFILTFSVLCMLTAKAVFGIATFFAGLLIINFSVR